MSVIPVHVGDVDVHVDASLVAAAFPPLPPLPSPPDDDGTAQSGSIVAYSVEPDSESAIVAVVVGDAIEWRSMEDASPGVGGDDESSSSS